MDPSEEGNRMEEYKDKIIEAYKKKLKAVRDYNKLHYKAYTIRLDYVKDADIINWLGTTKSIKGYICKLIRQDINNYEEV